MNAVEIRGLSHAYRGKTALDNITLNLPQGLGKNLYPTLSVRDNIAFHARLFGLNRRERDERIARLLAATGLTPFAERAAGKLSGGMKQKLSLCCALVRDILAARLGVVL